MKPGLIIIIVAAYFIALIIVSLVTGKGANNASFFTGNRKSPWFVVAFGMIGASLSGVTFISIPGAVGDKSMSYMQIVFGYLLGYIVVANILLPLYYKLKLSSIYEYLRDRLGFYSHKTGSAFFLLSRVVGASFRLYLVAIVLDRFILGGMGVPFAVTVGITILLIWIYSFKAGIKTIVYTDTLQTFFMITAVVITIFVVLKSMDFTLGEGIKAIEQSHYSKIFIWDWKAGNNFFKDFLSGAFITITMTGLDQDMMQKNLSCKSLKESQKNMYWMSSSLVFINLLFLGMGVLLYLFAHQKGIITENFGSPDLMKEGCHLYLPGTFQGDKACYLKDHLFPFISFNYLPGAAGIIFILGLIAAAYSSADSALTSLTTAFCIDFLGFNENTRKVKTRYLVHVGFSILLFLCILIFRTLNDDSVIYQLFKAAGYTYGPLLGLFAFGLFTRKALLDKWVPLVCVASPVLSFLLNHFSTRIFNGYEFGFEILLVNGLLTFTGLLIISRNKNLNNATHQN